MKALAQFFQPDADMLTGLVMGLCAALLFSIWLSYEDAALAAERRYRDAERLLVIVARVVEAERDKRGDGGASSRLAADRPAADCGGGQGHVPASLGGHDGRDVGKASASNTARGMIVE